jgi:hypothetical protein
MRRISRRAPTALLFVLVTLTLAPIAARADDAAAPNASSEPDVEPVERRSAAENRLLEQAEAIATRVARIRGLPLKKEIAKGIKNRAQLRATLVEKLDEEMTDAQIANEGRVYKELGLLPRSIDYKQMFLDLLTEQIAGFYDQQTKELYIMRGIPLALQRPAMAHELYHAIQDQHFDILSLQGPFSSTENSDFAIARSALIEGDATVTMIDFSLYESGELPTEEVSTFVELPFVARFVDWMRFDRLSAIEKLAEAHSSKMDESAARQIQAFQNSALSRAPTIVRDLLVFPYLAGLRFIVLARHGRSWSDIDAIYDDPPVSTEQIMHPEKYFQGDDPVLLSFDPADALPDDASLVYDTVFGELQTYLFLKHHLLADRLEKVAAGRSSAEDDSDEKMLEVQERMDRLRSAAAGWDGDRLLAYRLGDRGRTVVVHLSTWDSSADAREYYLTLRRVMHARFGASDWSQADGRYGLSTCLTHDQGDRDDRERIYLEQWGDMVLHIEGLPIGADAGRSIAKIRRAAMERVERKPIDVELAERREAAEQAAEHGRKAADEIEESTKPGADDRR